MKTFQKSFYVCLDCTRAHRRLIILVSIQLSKIQQEKRCKRGKKEEFHFIIEMKAAHLIVSDIRSLQDSLFIQFQIHSMIVVSSTNIRVPKGSHNWIGNNSPFVIQYQYQAEYHQSLCHKLKHWSCVCHCRHLFRLLSLAGNLCCFLYPLL